MSKPEIASLLHLTKWQMGKGGVGKKGEERGAKDEVKPNQLWNQIVAPTRCGATTSQAAPLGQKIFTAQWSQLQNQNVSLYTQRLLNSESTMFRVVRPLYPKVDIPSIIKNAKYTRRADSTKMLRPSTHYWQEQQRGTTIVINLMVCLVVSSMETTSFVKWRRRRWSLQCSIVS